jgi:hypothetical protein
MSVPPQQPGPYGQQPGWPQPDVPGGAPQPGQQPGYGQPYGQQPGGYYPQTGPQPQPGWGQQPYGTPPGGYGQPGQPGAYGQPGQFPGQFGPPQGGRKSPLPWILIGGGVLVVGIVVVLIVVLSGGPNSSDPKSVAQAYVDAVNNKDSSAMANVSCAADKALLDRAKNAPKNQQGQGQGSIPNIKLTLGDVKTNGDSATATATTNQGGTPIPLKLVKEGGAWKTCNISSGSTGG